MIIDGFTPEEWELYAQEMYSRFPELNTWLPRSTAKDIQDYIDSGRTESVIVGGMAEVSRSPIPVTDRDGTKEMRPAGTVISKAYILRRINGEVVWQVGPTVIH